MTSAKLFILGEERELLWTNTNYYRSTRADGSPTSDVEGGFLTLSFVSQENDHVFWHNMTKEVEEETERMTKGEVHFYKKGDEDIPIRKYKFNDAYLIVYSEVFYANGTENMHSVLTLSPAIQDYGTELVKYWNKSWIPPSEPVYYVPKQEKKEDRVVYINGHFYNKDGTFEGKVNEPDFEGSVDDVYVCDGKSTQKDKNGNENLTYNNTKLLKENNVNITHEKFINLASTVYGESSAYRGNIGIEKELTLEMFAIASVHKVNKIAYGFNSEQAKLFRNTNIEKRNGTKKQLAVGAIIFSLTSDLDASNGATMWDGAEQAAFEETDDRYSTGIFEIHMNTMGWTISDEHYEKWKEGVERLGASFKIPKEKYTPGENPKNKYSTSGTIALESTAVYLGTIFWKELKPRKKKPNEKE